MSRDYIGISSPSGNGLYKSVLKTPAWVCHGSAPTNGCYLENGKILPWVLPQSPNMTQRNWKLLRKRWNWAGSKLVRTSTLPCSETPHRSRVINEYWRSCLSPRIPYGLQWTLSTDKSTQIIYDLSGVEWSGVHWTGRSTWSPNGLSLLWNLTGVNWGPTDSDLFSKYNRLIT